MSFERRWYQVEARDATIQYMWENRGKYPLIQLPCGTGKSLVINDIIMEMLRYWPATQFIMLTHSSILVSQNFKKLQEMWPQAPAGVYSAGLKRRDTLHPIIFGTIASVAKCPKAFGLRHVAIIDEAHLISPDMRSMYQKTIEAMKEINPALIVLGLTATGWRTKEGRSTGAEGMFDDVSYDLTRPQDFERLIGEGYLAPVIGKRTLTQLDTTGVGTLAGEFNGAELQRAVNVEAITYSAIQEMMELGHDRKHWVLFGSGTLHVESITKILNSLGISAVCVHSHVHAAERKRRMELYMAGQARAIVGNKILSIGWNYPPCDLMGDLQPTQSVGYHIQKGGRIMRPSIATGKDNGLWLDFGCNLPNNGPIDYPNIPAGRTGKRTGDAPLKTCDACNAYNHTIVRFCCACGFEFIFKTKLTSTSSDANAMIGTAPVIEVFPVDHVSYLRHEKDGQKPSVKVTYTCGKNRYTEYVCMEHGGFPTKRAQSWWMERHASAPPLTTQAVLEMTKELRQPVAIRVHTNLKYPAILNPIWN